MNRSQQCVRFIVGVSAVAGLLGSILLPSSLLLDGRAEHGSLLTPWASVGGCGGGGSGGGSGGAVKWVGMGATGGLVDLQVMYGSNIGQNFVSKSVTTRLSIKPAYSSQLGLSIPVVSKSGPLQPQSNQEEEAGHITGGLGDLSVDYSLAVGMDGSWSINVGLGLPTGQYDIKRGKDYEKKYLPASLQKGSGLWSPSLGISKTKDVEDGLWIADLTYSHPMAVNFYGKNRFINNQTDQYNQLNQPSVWDQLTDEQKRRFEYYFKPYGENDLGAYTPPSVSASFTYGYRGITHFVHSWGASFSFPIGVAWIPDANCKNYNPKPDPDHKAWNGTLTYGLEFSREKFPIFIGVALPIHDQSAANTSQPPKDSYDTQAFGRWDPPDWKDIAQQWVVQVGVKATMF